MADTGAKLPGTAATSASAPYDDEAWADPNNIKLIDGYSARVWASSYDTNDYTQVLKASNFACGVPDGATIDGIKIAVQVLSVGAADKSKDVLAMLSKDNASRVGDNYAKNTGLPNPGAVWTYGGETDLWGTTWTAAEVNSASFAFHWACQALVDDANSWTNYMTVTVYYTEAAAGGASRSRVIVIGG